MSEHSVNIIQHNDICQLNISPATCLQWIESSFLLKDQAQLPAKVSVHPQGLDFFNTMPCLLPPDYGRFSVKVVHRIEGQTPSLGSDIMLYDSRTGQLLAIMDGDWITNMRTGAVAALAARLFRSSQAKSYSLLGLGNTARATAACIIADYAQQPVHFRLLRYKDQAEQFIERFADAPHVTFDIIDTIEELIGGATIIISCITSADGLLCDNDDLFAKGVLVIPVHTRGFQNCDLCFDKVFADDTAHVQNFKYFSQFRQFHELHEVLQGKVEGRANDEERILSYNIGLGLHDALFASNIYDLMENKEILRFTQQKEQHKFWI